MQTEDGRHEVRQRVVAEIGADVADPQALARGQGNGGWVRQPREAKSTGRLDAALRVPAGFPNIYEAFGYGYDYGYDFVHALQCKCAKEMCKS